jgi:hypothetical protein
MTSSLVSFVLLVFLSRLKARDYVSAWLLES